jgi:two-component system, OmpR family, KDP operon response regulator KdpE
VSEPRSDSPIRVLVVDDDPTITRVYNQALTSQGFAVLTAASCAEAMKEMEAANGDVQVFVVDFSLPDCDGADFVRDATAKFGERATMYVSGWTDEFWQLQDTPGRWIVLRKPVAVKKLIAGVSWLGRGGPKPPELDEE